MTDTITAAPDDVEMSLTEVAATDPDVDMGRIESLGWTLEDATPAILVRRRIRKLLAI